MKTVFGLQLAVSREGDEVFNTKAITDYIIGEVSSQLKQKKFCFCFFLIQEKKPLMLFYLQPVLMLVHDHHVLKVSPPHSESIYQ